MNRTALLALGAMLATPAAAQDRGCPDMRALLNADGNDFRNVGWTMAAGVGAFATVRGRRVGMPAATSCDLNVDDQWSQFACRWEFRDSAAAGAGYDRLRGGIDRCLARPLRVGFTSGTGGAVRIAQKHERSFVSGSRETAVSLTLFEHAQGGRPEALYVVELNVSLDTVTAISPEEVEDDE